MSIDVSYFRAIQGATGLSSIQQIEATETKERIKIEMLDSIGCQYDSTRNGVAQKFVVTQTDRVSRMNIIAFPDEDLEYGDVIYCYGQYWIVTYVYATNTIQKSGKMQQCNLNLQFQIGDSPTVYSRWCFFDKGVYSTTLSGGVVMQTGDMQFKVFLPYDNQTKLIRRDKRLATEVLDYPDGHQELSVFEVTATDSVGGSFGAGKLLELKVREGTYNPAVDSVELMICDYVEEVGSSDGGGGWI